MIIELLSLLALLFFKHFLADFVIQDQHMVKDKGTYGAVGGLIHSFQHTILTLCVLLWFNPAMAIGLAIVDGILHYHIDWAKMNLSEKLIPTDQKFWTWLGADQLLHHLTYLGIAYVALS